jgi:hypothetical protein
VKRKQIFMKCYTEPKREQVARGGKEPHHEELRNLYASPDIISAIKSRRVT